MLASQERLDNFSTTYFHNLYGYYYGLTYALRDLLHNNFIFLILFWDKKHSIGNNFVWCGEGIYEDVIQDQVLQRFYMKINKKKREKEKKYIRNKITSTTSNNNNFNDKFNFFCFSIIFK